MKKIAILTLHLTVFATIAAGVFFSMRRAGYSLLVALVSAYFLVLLIIGSLSYWSLSRRLRLEGKKPPPYLQYLILPTGVSSLNKAAPRASHILVGIVTAIAGAFFLICGVALAVTFDWSRPDHRYLAAAFSVGLAGIGAAFFRLTWRLFAFARAPRSAA